MHAQKKKNINTTLILLRSGSRVEKKITGNQQQNLFPSHLPIFSEQIFLRGFDIDHGTDINLTVDGIPVNMVSHAHGQGYADLHWVIPELIEKINFNKGPYFADKGNFTTAGFVEFKTKDYLEKSFVKAEGGQFGTFRGITGINLLKQNQDKRNQSLFFAGEASFTKGFFESPQNFNRFNGMLKYRGSISDKTTLTATATGFTSKWNASGQIPDRAVENGSIGFYGAIDNTEGGETSRYNANLELHTNLNIYQLITLRYPYQTFYDTNLSHTPHISCICNFFLLCF